MTTDLQRSEVRADKPTSGVPARFAVGLTMAAAIATGARLWWDADYQAEEGAMIGQVPVLLLVIGFCSGVAARAGKRPLTVPLMALLVSGATCIALLIGGVGDGFVGLRPAAFILGFVIAALGAVASAAIVGAGNAMVGRRA